MSQVIGCIAASKVRSELNRLSDESAKLEYYKGLLAAAGLYFPPPRLLAETWQRNDIKGPADLRKKIAELAGELEDTQDRLNQSVEYNQQLEHT
ncbi:hypothetical protein EB796_001157 [Bugula neritina]|uniref:Uncharacterized protein n=1 Tax=Bugula neritina TaxID=10212 RepID=A0A7J7KQU2_BUGNE|nr:hypothetical protein EB796_001157 [Bugula neritina]